MKIFLDPGHNYSGGDRGASGYGLKEEIVSFEIANVLRSLLENAGYEVKMSRETLTENVGNGSVSSSVTTRAETANAWGADLFVSIHCNAGGGTGTEALVYTEKGDAFSVAERILNAVCARLETRKRGVKERPDLGVLRLTKCPAVLVETAFLDNENDAWLLKTKQADFAAAICEGITGEAKREETLQEKQSEGDGNNMAKTVMTLSGEIYVQEIEPKAFEIMPCDCSKTEISLENYFNCGYFAVESGGKTIPVGNLANNGEIYAQAKDNADWLNLAGHKLTTVYTLTDGTCGITKTDDLGAIRGLKTAVSGIPIIVGGKYVGMEEIKSEGYFGNELYDTWNGFLGIRHGKLVYVGMKCGFEEMCWALVALGIYDAVKLDGGGSYILKNGEIIRKTSENRRINNVGVWA